MKSSIRLQLYAMMFLNFFVWGIWFVTMGKYITDGSIKASGVQSGLAYGTQCLGAIIAPFIIGMIADRFFAAQKILGVLHLLGAGMLYLLSSQTEFGSFYWCLLIYMILYMPTLALVNSIALKQVTDAEKEFSGIRMWGTIGWIAAGLIITLMAWDSNSESLGITFKVAALVAAVFGVFSFFLPDTPPPKAGQQVSVSEVLGLDALKILRNRNYLLFFIASILICIPLAFYYGQAYVFLSEVGMQQAAAKMTMGQIAETVFLFLMPFFFARFGTKQMILFGMLAWILRYALFSYGDADSNIWMLYGGIILHGICYDFFFVTGQIYTDQVAGPRVRSSAQGMITLATYGLGMFIGFYIAGKQVDQNEYKDGIKFTSTIASKIATSKSSPILLKIDSNEVNYTSGLSTALKNKKSGEKVSVQLSIDGNVQEDSVTLKSFSDHYSIAVKQNPEQLLGIEVDTTQKSSTPKGIVFKNNFKATHNWLSIWLFPCLFAAGVALMFLAFFRNSNKTNAA